MTVVWVGYDEKHATWAESIIASEFSFLFKFWFIENISCFFLTGFQSELQCS